MFKRILSIQDIGNFAKVESIELSKITLIFGLNGFGKSTLADIFRSLSPGLSEILTGRKRIKGADKKARPIVKLAFGDDSGLEEKIVAFDRNWNPPDLPFDIEIFDTCFVDQNIFTGLVPQRSNKVNLTNLILGRENVKSGLELESLNKQKNAKKRELNHIANQLRNHVGQNFDVFLKLPKPENKTALEEAIDHLRVEKRRYRGMIDKAGSILKLPEPKALPIYRLDSLCSLMSEISELLNKEFKTLEQEALSKLELHIAQNFKQPDGEENAWIEKGLTYAGPGPDADSRANCPFCGQGLDPARNLLDTYRAFFGQAYQDYSKTLQADLKAKNASLKMIIDDLGILSNDVRENLNRFNSFKEHLDTSYSNKLNRIDNLSTRILQLSDSLRQALNQAQADFETRISEKLKTPFESGNIPEIAAVKFCGLLDKLFQNLDDYQAALSEISVSILDLKQMADTYEIQAEIDRLDTEIKQLEIELKRHEFDREVRAILMLQAEEIELVQQIKDKQIALQGENQQFTDQYFSYVNSIFKAFDPDLEFRIAPSLDSKGYRPVYCFQIAFRNTPIADKSMSHTLSDGDRRTLALSVFLGKLKHKKEKIGLQNSVVILDDPVVSLDNNRSDRVVKFIDRLLPSCRQVIILSYHKPFLRKLFAQIREYDDVGLLNLIREGEQSRLQAISDFDFPD